MPTNGSLQFNPIQTKARKKYKQEERGRERDGATAEKKKNQPRHLIFTLFNSVDFLFLLLFLFFNISYVVQLLVT